MTIEDVSYLNRVSHERTHEVAYCGFIQGGQLRPWLADTIHADDTEISFSTSNCRRETGGGGLKAILHTHPHGPALLSDVDLQLFDTDQFEIQCIQAGRITSTPSTVTTNLRCYRRAHAGSNTTIIEIPVIVTRRNA